MTPRDFVYWLQGLFEITGAGGKTVESLTPEQIKMIRDHLGYVFAHMGKPDSGGDANSQPPPSVQLQLQSPLQWPFGTVIC